MRQMGAMIEARGYAYGVMLTAKTEADKSTQTLRGGDTMNEFTRNRGACPGALVGALVGALLLSAGLSAETPVEVTLTAELDEPRGFCFDTRGFQANARPEDGLQTHSCYSYQGQLGVDQAFDADGVADAVFRLIEFDLCMTATALAAGAEFALEPCDGSANQRFEHRPDGRVVSLAAPGHCVTAGEGPSRHGGGGSPVHLIRDLTLEACDSGRGDRQQWRLRETAD